jgi:hypothetical protein
MPLMPSSPRERKLLIVLGVVVLLIGGFLVFRAVTGGGGETEAAGPDTGTPTAPATTAPSPAPSPTETLTFSGRDPFKPLIAPASTSSSGEGTTPPTTYTPPAGGSSTPPPTTPPPTPTPTTTGSTPPPSTDCPGQSVTINEHHVTICDIWTMDGTDWVKIYLKNDGDDGAFLDVYEGQTFEYVFKVVSIDDPCASFLHGETPFTLCLTGS